MVIFCNIGPRFRLKLASVQVLSDKDTSQSFFEHFDYCLLAAHLSWLKASRIFTEYDGEIERDESAAVNYEPHIDLSFMVYRLW